MKHFKLLTQEINVFLSSNQSQALILLKHFTFFSPRVVYIAQFLYFNLKVATNGTNQSDNHTVPNIPSGMSLEEVAMGFIRVANEAMCRPIRALTQVILDSQASRNIILFLMSWHVSVYIVSLSLTTSVNPQAKGHDTSQHVLACFGGAGGQHACAIARALGMKTVFIHK